MILKIGLLLFFILNSIFLHAEEFPSKNIKFVVYTKAGGLIDTSARKIAKILEDQYVDHNIVVENYPGAAGLKSLYHFLKQPSDGHIVYAITNSFISQVVAAGKQNLLDDLHYLTIVAEDYECLIVNKESQFDDIEKLKVDGLIWAGPAAGGTDHLFAKQSWLALGMKAKWLPYSSGKQGMLAVAGGHADVYVGNPGDSIGFDQLKVLGLAAPKRLAAFPNVPTFRELEYPDLEGEVLWRGFAIHKKTKKSIIQKWEDLITQAVKHSDWVEYLEKRSIAPTVILGAEFEQKVKTQIRKEQKIKHETQKYLADYWHYFILLLLLLITFFLYLIDPNSRKVNFNLRQLALVLVYISSTYFLNYFFVTCFFIIAYSFLFKVKIHNMISILLVWNLFAYFVFYKILMVPLI